MLVSVGKKLKGSGSRSEATVTGYDFQAVHNIESLKAESFSSNLLDENEIVLARFLDSKSNDIIRPVFKYLLSDQLKPQPAPGCDFITLSNGQIALSELKVLDTSREKIILKRVREGLNQLRDSEKLLRSSRGSLDKILDSPLGDADCSKVNFQKVLYLFIKEEGMVEYIAEKNQYKYPGLIAFDEDMLARFSDDSSIDSWSLLQSKARGNAEIVCLCPYSLFSTLSSQYSMS